ncbi:sigma-54-dependent Fis family transcriptional regulator [Prolixibacteraceae bacterium JC049]|nr:sigma-54-dependent Fis family transcriptional regulator [Prolixibacteraceae bacterium JC049]
MEALKILILDDEERITEKLKYHLEKSGYDVTTANFPNDAYKLLAKESFHILLLDVILPGANGLEILKKVKEMLPELQVIMISGFGDMDMVIQAMRNGAVDFIRKPFQIMDIQLAIDRTANLLRLQTQLQKTENRHSLVSRELEQIIEKDFVGESDGIKRVIQMAIKAAQDKDVNVLITGENGTGKEIVARIIHYASPRKEQEFAPVNSSAIPESLLESEFFGHVKGSFTDAKSDRSGYFELANDGTLFLDEIGDMPIALQAKLLRAIEEGRIKRVGGNREIPVDVRIISATNRNIQEMISEQKFRMDLYHRINTIIIEIPPLRERPEDIESLVKHFVQLFARKKNVRQPEISKEAIRKLRAYSFPGNVRELRNLIERAMILMEGESLNPEDFILNDTKYGETEEVKSLNLDENEIHLIKIALRNASYNQTLASGMLGISRDALKRKIKKFGIEIQKHV